MFYGQREEKPYPLNFVMKPSELLCQGYIGVMLLTFNLRKKKQKASLQFVSSEKFSGKVTGTAMLREIDYEIKLILDAKSISKALYRIAPMELKKLKIQLDELLQKVFIRLSKCSSMGCLVLFVKKKDETL